MLDPSKVSLLGKKWQIKDDNYIKLGKQKLEVHNLILKSERQEIAARSINDEGIHLDLTNIDLGWLYHLGKPLPKIEIDGRCSGGISMQNVFTQGDISADFLIDTLIINEDYWGSNTRLDLTADSLKAPFKGSISHSSAFVDSLWSNIQFTPILATADSAQQNFLDIGFNILGAKAKILENNL